MRVNEPVLGSLDPIAKMAKIPKGLVLGEAMVAMFLCLW